MKSAKLSPPDATRTGVCPAFKVGSPTSWMASASGPERLVIIKALMQGSLAGWIRYRVCVAANYIDPSLIFCRKKPRRSKRYCQEWPRPSGCQPLGSDNEGLFARYCHQVYTLGEGLLSLSGHASTGRGRGADSSP